MACGPLTTGAPSFQRSPALSQTSIFMECADLMMYYGQGPMDSGVFCHEIDDWPCIKVSEESSTCNCTRYWRDMHWEELLPEWITPQQNHLPLLFLYRDGGMWVRKCQFLRITTDYPAKSTGIKPPWPRSWSLRWQMLRLGEGNSLYGLSYPSGLFIIKFIHLWGSVAINNKRNYHLRNHTQPVTVVGDDG